MPFVFSPGMERTRGTNGKRSWRFSTGRVIPETWCMVPTKHFFTSNAGCSILSRMNKIRNFDAEFCGKVPLNQTNLIQPHGVLLVIKKDDLSILQASENADSVFGQPAEEIVKRKWNDFLSDSESAQFAHLFKGAISVNLPFQFRVNNQLFLSLVEQQELFYLLEIENAPHKEGADTSFVTIYQDVKKVMAAIDSTTTTE